MLILIAAMTVLLLGLWTAVAWAAHAVWTLLATLPWAEVLARLQALDVPPWLAPCIGSGWQAWLDAAAPLLRQAGHWLQTSAAWLGDAVAVLIWLAWGLGAALLLLLAGLVAGVVALSRRRTAAAAA